MANLKEIRNRIGSVSSTMQITSAMKMVSAAKLKKAQDSIIAMRPYSIKLTELIQSLNTIVSRRINIINNPAVISVGMVKAGTRNNIIPEDAEIMGTIRTFDPDLRKEIYSEIEQVAEGVALGTGTKISVEFDVGGFFPETYNDPKLVDAMKESLMKASPGRFVESNIPVTGAEDFSYFSKEIPGFYFWLGVNKPGVGLDSSNFGERTDVAGNHSPYFYVDDSALDEGLRAFVHLVDDYPDKF